MFLFIENIYLLFYNTYNSIVLCKSCATLKIIRKALDNVRLNNKYSIFWKQKIIEVERVVNNIYIYIWLKVYGLISTILTSMN